MKGALALAFSCGLLACSGEVPPTIPSQRAAEAIAEPQEPVLVPQREAATSRRTVPRPQYQLLDQLVWGGIPIDPDSYDEEVRREIEDYLKRYAEHPAQRDTPGIGVASMVANAQARYERRLAAMSTAPEAPELARAYVAELRPCYEWEGYSDCPVREAKFAAQYLNAHPDSPFRDYLPLLEAHRWICAAEGFENENSAPGVASSRDAYRKALSAAMGSHSRMVRVAAAELGARERCHP